MPGEPSSHTPQPSLATALPGRITRSRGRLILSFLLLTVLFALAYAQSPLYTSNQNQYFLRGAADAGIGDLADDWLVSTKDSTPVFSLLVQVVFRYLPPAAFYLIYALLLGVYLVSLIGIILTLQPERNPRYTLLLATLLIGLHSAALRYLLARIPGEHWEYLLEAGFAGQRLLGAVLQPSSFGVLLILSVLLYLRRKPFAAVVVAVLAATVHPTYLLSAAALTLAYMVGVWLETRQLKKPVLIGLAALAAVLPMLVYVLSSFSPSSAEMTREAQELLVNFRIPQHTQITLWFDTTSVLKLLLIAGALRLTRRTRLFPLLMVPTIVMVLLTALQVVLDSNQLALLFPWRLSTWLVPLALAVVTGKALWRLMQKSGKLQTLPWVPAACIVLTLMLAAAGCVKFRIESQRQAEDPANPMMAFVREHSEGGQVYLIPPKLQTFRLETGEPAMVDFKSIPYSDREVLQWYGRVKLAQHFYRDKIEYISCDLLKEAAEAYDVTHVVLGENQLGLSCPALVELYRDGSYGVYRLQWQSR